MSTRPEPTWSLLHPYEMVSAGALRAEMRDVLHDPESYANVKLRLIGKLEKGFESSVLRIDGMDEERRIWASTCRWVPPVPTTVHRGPRVVNADAAPCEIIGYLDSGAGYGHMAGWPFRFTIVEAYPYPVADAEWQRLRAQTLAVLERDYNRARDIRAATEAWIQDVQRGVPFALRLLDPPDARAPSPTHFFSTRPDPWIGPRRIRTDTLHWPHVSGSHAAWSFREAWVEDWDDREIPLLALELSEDDSAAWRPVRASVDREAARAARFEHGLADRPSRPDREAPWGAVGSWTSEELPEIVRPYVQAIDSLTPEERRDCPLAVQHAVNDVRRSLSEVWRWLQLKNLTNSSNPPSEKRACLTSAACATGDLCAALSALVPDPRFSGGEGDLRELQAAMHEALQLATTHAKQGRMPEEPIAALWERCRTDPGRAAMELAALLRQCHERIRADARMTHSTYDRLEREGRRLAKPSPPWPSQALMDGLWSLLMRSYGVVRREAVTWMGESARYVPAR